MSAPDLSFLAEPGAVADWRQVLLLDVATDAGLLAALPGRAGDLARALDLDEQAVRVVLDALGAWDVVVADGAGGYALGPGAPDEEAAVVLYHHARALRSWTGRLDDRLRGADSPPVPPAAQRPDRWMAALAVGARRAAEAVVDATLALAPDAATVLDLGGGHGEYAIAFAGRGLGATLQDRPAIVDVARDVGRVEAAGVELFAGDFFETLPGARYDLVFCSGVTHTMAGDRVAELFRRAAGLVVPGGSLAVQTFLRGRHPLGAVFAVQMLANGSGGDTHGEEDYRRWLAGAGFAEPQVVDLEEGRRSLLVARAAG